MVVLALNPTPRMVDFVRVVLHDDSMMKSKAVTLAITGTLAFIGADAVASNLDTGEQNARFQSVDTTFNADAAPELHVRVISGVASLVEGSDVEDLFPSTTGVTEVLVTIEPPSGEVIEVTATSGPTWTEDPTSGNWEATFAMPAAGGTTLGEYDIVVDPDGSALSCAGKFKVKKTTGGSTGG